MRQVTILIMILLIAGCKPNTGKQMRNFNAIPSFSSDYVNAVIEIPAGTNKKYEYRLDKKMFLADYIDGKERMVDFLPYPGNYGFVPNTYMDPKLGGDGDPLDILVIAESVKTGTMLEVIPIWIIYFEDRSDLAELREMDYKIIAVPADFEKRVITAISFEELQLNYPDILFILERWFLSYKGRGVMKVTAWGDGEDAMNEIKKWQISF
jgi:inorganic pyrophosphatase